MLVYYDSLSLSISFSSQLKTCHQARQTYEINPLVSSESVSVRTSYFKAIVSSDSRHALARLQSLRQLDTRYANTTISHFSCFFLQEPDVFEDTRCGRYQEFLWNLLEKPDTSLAAKIVSIISILFIMVSTVAMTLNTVPSIADR